jgi:acetyl-CoA carboxylase biotin carboxylase subunit
MIRKILVANRGEIAVRIIRACRELGIQSVAAYSEADRESLPVLLADEDFCIGPASAKLSYLNSNAIIQAAKATGADAIHPGYGFLSENAEFADACRNAGLIFIGPDAEHIRMMGDKAKAREVMQKAGVPIVPGTEGAVGDLETLKTEAERIGYPLMVKAASGGGGRGMRVVESAEGLEIAWQTARSEAGAAFGDDRVYLERRIVKPRHVEVQILADTHGNVLTLGERDCSLQRRNQKVIEESPCPALSEEQRQGLYKAAADAARAVQYIGAGTIEFLFDSTGEYYFMEMNTRIQVEHPVTEMVTGIDLIQAQIKVAGGEALSLGQEDVRIQGHAMECRINAEDPTMQFRPAAGTVEALHLAGGFGVRNDFFIYQDYKVPHCYDSMLGKIIVWGETRSEALNRMKRVLDETIISGLKTNLEFQKCLIELEDFQSGDFNTGTLEASLDELILTMNQKLKGA